MSGLDRCPLRAASFGRACVRTVWLCLALIVAGCGEKAPQSDTPEPDSMLADYVLIDADGGAPPFLMDRFEVTNGAFARFLAETGHAWRGRDDATWPRSVEKEADHPVTRVSLHDARAFAKWRGGRVPTVREWVRATRRARQDDYPWGRTAPEQYYANVLSSGLGGTAPVGTFPTGAARSGAHDVLGNVWEWTETVPHRWADPPPPPVRRVHIYHWLPSLLPHLDTEIERRRVELEFPPEAAAAPSEYVGEGRVVVGGGYRNRFIENLPHDAVTGEIAYEELQRDVMAVQLLQPNEWRDDVGFRCVRSIGAAEARALARRGGERSRAALERIDASVLRAALALLRPAETDARAMLEAALRRAPSAESPDAR